MKKAIIASALAICLLAQAALFTACSENITGNLAVTDRNGEKIAALKTISEDGTELAKNRYRAYVETVIEESEKIVAELQNCSTEEARKYLLSSECVITTAFDGTVYDSVDKAYKNLECEQLDFGCAVTDLEGNLLTLYSAGKNSGEFYNRATEKTPPYSSFKPLCVYTPALESGKADWSTVFPDEPIKKIPEKNGKLSDWPANATGTYSHKNTTLAYALKTSLNTVAVRCMQKVTVADSVKFMEDTWGLTLPYEKGKEKTYGEDEVIGNVALGYLNGGVSPADMAGYYQTFANGGFYTKPHTVLKITDKKGTVIYEYKAEAHQVIKSSTAYIMNKLLQNVVSAGGTGEKAACDGIAVGGKTGTGDSGNWFVGFTPEYSCAVWHGTALSANRSCEVFSNAVSGFPKGEKQQFPNCSAIKKAAYCCESGMLISQKCSRIDMGYFASDSLPEVCNIHN